MDWLDHPRYVGARDRALAYLSSPSKYRFHRLDHVVFLCGGFQSSRRDRLAQYIRTQHKQVLVFYAEAVWDVIAAHSPSSNALDMEEQLAELADMVLVVVESPGTFAELGAFAISPALRVKLLPVLEAAHQHADSFLNTGPVRWVSKDSSFAPPIWTSHKAILGAAADIDDRLGRLPPQRKTRVADLASSPKHLVFFICDLVTVFGPCSQPHLTYYLGRLLPGAVPELAFYLGLGSALDLIESFQHQGVDYYHRPVRGGTLQAFQEKRRFLDIPTLRAQTLAGLQMCSGFAEVMAARP